MRRVAAMVVALTLAAGAQASGWQRVAKATDGSLVSIDFGSLELEAALFC